MHWIQPTTSIRVRRTSKLFCFSLPLSLPYFVLYNHYHCHYSFSLSLPLLLSLRHSLYLTRAHFITSIRTYLPHCSHESLLPVQSPSVCACLCPPQISPCLSLARRGISSESSYSYYSLSLSHSRSYEIIFSSSPSSPFSSLRRLPHRREYQHHSSLLHRQPAGHSCVWMVC